MFCFRDIDFFNEYNLNVSSIDVEDFIFLFEYIKIKKV